MNFPFSSRCSESYLSRSWASAVVCTIFTLLTLTPESTCASDRADLIPAAFGIWTDVTGSPWSVEAAGNIGRIGSAMVNSGLALLIDDEKFVPHRPMMTPDGKELILQGIPMDAWPGLRTQRRIRMMDDPGGLRYTELFLNNSANEISFSVALATNFSGNFKTFLSDHGRSEPLILGPRETSLIVLPGTSQSSRAFLFTLAGASGGERPTISSQNRYALTFRYRIDLAPGETAAIVHHVAQIAIPQSMDRRSLLKSVQPFALDRLRSTFDSDWLPFVINALPPSKATPRTALEAGGISSLDSLSTESDLLVMGEGSRLTGSVVSDGPIRLRSPLGEAEFSLAQIAAITGPAFQKLGQTRLYLRDGQILSGTLQVKNLAFQPTEGETIALDLSRLDRLVCAHATPMTAWPEQTPILLVTRDGDRIRIAPSDGKTELFQLSTAWGSIPVMADHLIWLHPAETPGAGFRVLLQNGTASEGFLLDSAVSLPSITFGETKISALQIESLYTDAAWMLHEADSRSLISSSITLTGNQRFDATMAEASLAVEVDDGTLIQTPISEIQRIERKDWTQDLLRVRIDRWDGGVLTGFLMQSAVNLTTNGQSWIVPSKDILQVDFASPKLTPEIQEKIKKLVSDLGSEDWAVRERASRELDAFGYLAHPVLKRELATATDPEVIQRLEMILDPSN